MAARAPWLALLFLLAPLQAAASTLNFVSIEAFFDELSAPPPGPDDGWSGTYVEGEYAVDVFANAASREIRDGQLGIHDGGAGAGTLFSDVVIRRTDGHSFILESFKISEVMSNYFGYYTFEPPEGDQPRLEQVLALQWPNLELVGTKTDGSTVSARVSAWRDSVDNEGTIYTESLPWEIATGVWTSDPTSPYFTPDLARYFTEADFGPDFRNLSNLRVNFVRPPSIDELVCSSQSVRRVDPVFAPLSSCASLIRSEDGSGSFVVLPDGSTIRSMFMDGPRNDSGYVFIETMTLPVPLPPSALLILGAFGALAGLRRRRRWGCRG